jgi:hypothetical protein
MTHPIDLYHYEAEGHAYDLKIVAHKFQYGWRVLWAEMYSVKGNYVGNWQRSQMPLELIRNLEAWCKYAAAMGIPLDGSDWAAGGDLP